MSCKRVFFLLCKILEERGHPFRFFLFWIENRLLPKENNGYIDFGISIENIGRHETCFGHSSVTSDQSSPVKHSLNFNFAYSSCFLRSFGDSTFLIIS